ncbi:HD domain-containing protein [Dethiosulfatarculus sandiegensis]|uniref:HD domain-containing protein n=1 Tax=Dethiosulfatarculus sandiegensis TaxID=1429043 RepID=A0A0D2GDR3_9BACT|nr:HD domain-containing protein [Dethiosulfatarculus sandiegensis]KIX13082.1 hypothetical protein X474_16080 [Dethiosulfatarculus sandiegensis]
MKQNKPTEQIEQGLIGLTRIKDQELKNDIIACWQRCWNESAWENLKDCPFNPHLSDVSLVEHVNCLTDLVLGAADSLEKHNPELKLDRQYLITGVLLHDVSKLVEIEPSDEGPIFSALNRQMPHATYGAMVAMAQGLSPKIANIILAHTKLTGATPDSPEAVLLHYLDYGMADVLRASRKLPLIMVGGSKFGK